jgi:glycosyltransferase involved in cell wall biosynthesis
VFKSYNVKEPNYERNLRSRAAKLGIGGSIRWIEDVGFESLHELYALADIILNFPAMDALPATFMEAAASQTPVITARLLAYEGTFALDYFTSVEPGDVSCLAIAIAEQVNAVAENPRYGDQTLCGARRVVEEQFSEVHYRDQILAIFEELRQSRTQRATV